MKSDEIVIEVVLKIPNLVVVVVDGHGFVVLLDVFDEQYRSVLLILFHLEVISMVLIEQMLLNPVFVLGPIVPLDSLFLNCRHRVVIDDPYHRYLDRRNYRRRKM